MQWADEPDVIQNKEESDGRRVKLWREHDSVCHVDLKFTVCPSIRLLNVICWVFRALCWANKDSSHARHWTLFSNSYHIYYDTKGRPFCWHRGNLDSKSSWLGQLENMYDAALTHHGHAACRMHDCLAGFSRRRCVSWCCKCILMVNTLWKTVESQNQAGIFIRMT